MSQFDEWVASVTAERQAAGLWRRPRTRTVDDGLLDLASNDYLGLARDPRVVAAAVDAARRWGAGSTGSRLVSGTTQLHVELEEALAELAEAPAALVFASGYAANLAVLQALTDADTIVVSDAGNHASIIDGCRLSRAQVAVAAHNDLGEVEWLLARRRQPRAVVVTDSVFSVDGDLARLDELHRVCQRRDALLVVDEAHAVGVLGPGGAGAAVAVGLGSARDVVRTVTLSKSLGSQGGAVVASRPIIDLLVSTARTFIFDTALAPACAGAALEALRILRDEPQLADVVRRRAADLAVGLGAPPPAAAVVNVVLGQPALAVAAADRCHEQGVAVGCFRPPSVPDGTSRLRITARADLTDDDVATAVAVVVDAVKRTT